MSEPCPFCGERLNLEARVNTLNLRWYVVCGTCGACGPDSPGRVSAQANWDERVKEDS